MEFIQYIVSNLAASSLMVFGVCLMFGVLGGILAHRIVWVPTITAFMLLGLAIGPNGIQLITKTMLHDAEIVVNIALGLILYQLGTMLHPKEMMRSRRLIWIALAEGVFTFALVFGGALLVGVNMIVSAMIAAIAVSSSPAVLVHVAEEMHAQGPVTERAKSLVALNNLAAFVLFSVALPFGMAIEKTSLLMIIGIPAFRLLGAVIIGISVAWLAVRIARSLRVEEEHYRFALVIGAVTLAIGISTSIGASALFAPLVLGLATRWFETRKSNLSKVGLGEGADLFLIVLFVLAGAKINFGSLVDVGWLAVFLIALRCIGKIGGVYLAGYFNDLSLQQSYATSLLLIPMAGMAIGIVTTTFELVPDLGGEIATIVFAMVAVFETIGPFLAVMAFQVAGESGKRDAVSDDWQQEVRL